MASVASEDALTKASTEGAQDFVDAYYTALQNSRPTISTYYVPKTTAPDGTTTPDIIWNGNTYEDGLEFQKMYEDSMPTFVHFDVQAIDCQILNPQYSKETTTPGGMGVKPERNISFLVMTAGHMRLEDRSEGPLFEFSETFLLVPNLEKGGKGVMGARRGWLIQTQSFRYVVVHDPVLTAGQTAMDIA
ncbi:NTF2-like protein [Tothia fuscella]|uniref:NTF2-like protein n=1 Tax=Tothia fuscella TaxID=1048955 RepID=A0A9P4P1K3_9PEZI|nr:NTF2-like protein [Tothia fuscella]